MLLDARGVADALERLSQEIIDFAGGTDRLVLVGIQRRGAELAERLTAAIRDGKGAEIPLGVMDITLYRDDLQTI
ncbi:MAG: phosphoribosyltransferase family protein, partial [Gemmatimonadales bacterium]